MAGLTTGIVCSSPRGGGALSESAFLACDGQIRWYDGGASRTSSGHGPGILLGVAGGLGPQAGIASAAAARIVANLYRDAVPDEPSIDLIHLIGRAHDRAYAAASRVGSVELATSLSLGWVIGGQLHWVQVGSSAIYLVRDRRVLRLTPVHTRHEFALRDGQPTPAAPAALTQAFLYGSRGFGADARLRLEPGLDSGAEYLQVGDWLISCTAGLRPGLTPGVVVDLVRRHREPQRVADELAVRGASWCGGRDLTAVVARVERVPSATVPISGRPGTGQTFL